ncbi:MAG: DNA polymerase III subunit gamma/tau [Epsilonproteobacteria bacterium]|nr:DNA polymerase III subunit gamma/tau [Campylobacterota bacterium]
MDTPNKNSLSEKSPTASGLNLARSWRPQTFEHIVGQHIPVKMLKNSLYLNKIFPVYLFAGQRGCGKTTTARVFAAAINCEQLEQFRTNPTTQLLPCQQCSSCKAMAKSAHPDFIEIDAASHTGVDNVRSIIDSSSYMPMQGRKKVYLIDEAHMLSKAAFNALLKVLEEPPETVLFILATTETHKIPETVLSRCFQALFGPINTTLLKQHLQEVCNAEAIEIEPDALELIIGQTDGSARDALNLLERVRFSHTLVSYEAVVDVLGHIAHKDLYALFGHIIAQDGTALLAHLDEINFSQRNATLLFDMLVELCRSLLHVKYGVKSALPSNDDHAQTVKHLAGQCSLNRLHAIMQLMWSQEELFLKTPKKHAFLELMLLQLCEQVSSLDLEQLINACNTGGGSPTLSLPKVTPPAERIANPIATPQPQAAPLEHANPHAQAWAGFLTALEQANADPMLLSIFRQASVLRLDQEQQKVHLELAHVGTLFTDKITDTKKLWLPVLEKTLGNFSDFILQAGGTKTKTPAQRTSTPLPPLPAKQVSKSFSRVNTQTKRAPSAPKENHEEPIDVRDEQKWPLTHLIMRFFPGKIRKVKVVR